MRKRSGWLNSAGVSIAELLIGIGISSVAILVSADTLLLIKRQEKSFSAKAAVLSHQLDLQHQIRSQKFVRTKILGTSQILQKCLDGEYFGKKKDYCSGFEAPQSVQLKDDKSLSCFRINGESCDCTSKKCDYRVDVTYSLKCSEEKLNYCPTIYIQGKIVPLQNDSGINPKYFSSLYNQTSNSVKMKPLSNCITTSNQYSGIDFDKSATVCKSLGSYVLGCDQSKSALITMGVGLESDMCFQTAKETCVGGFTELGLGEGQKKCLPLK
ncbi:MAG: hypothetical protein KUL82_02605 [Bdellovibrio sp.]|nr:hypothetical protein [Bdellovibrio sp.]